jgi:hypothetical protein
MKNKGIAHAHEAARIYQQYYKPSLNPLRLMRSVIAVFISGSGPASTVSPYRRSR